MDSGSSLPMDVDPDPSTGATHPISNGSTSSPAVCLPYSSVPGMDTSSKIYRKAIATLKKQKNNVSCTVKSSPFPPFTVFDASTFISFISFEIVLTLFI